MVQTDLVNVSGSHEPANHELAFLWLFSQRAESCENELEITMTGFDKCDRAGEGQDAPVNR